MRRTLALAALAATALATTGLAGNTSPEMTSLTLKLQKTEYGQILFDGKGRVLYSFTRDRRGQPSRCYGDCAAAWPVYYAPKGALTAGAGVKKALLGTTKRRSGRLQVTYNGWPLYYYAHEGAGEVKCHNVETHGGIWRVMRASGKAVR